MKHSFLLVIVFCMLTVSAVGQDHPAALIPSHDTAREAAAVQVAPDPNVNAPYVLVTWTELGMHCIDGKDYSIFSVLPPFNVIHAQLIHKTEPPVVINSGSGSLTRLTWTVAGPLTRRAPTRRTSGTTPALCF